MKTKLMLGDNIESLKKLPDNSIDSVVTDPPYGLSFMNKKWDYEVPSVEFWKEVHRVLKPGGHILSFGGTRTYHRMVVNIEDAGFEIRDQIMWLYGSGFPKSHNIGKAVDKLEGNEREIVGVKENWLDTNNRKEGDTSMYDSAWVDNKRVDLPITKGSSPYEGWGTALKPANEPICLARKPLSEKSVAENVLKWGTGGINVDGCRVGSEIIKTNGVGGNNNTVNILCKRDDFNGETHEGRFPANLILECICDNREESESHENPMCPCRLLDEQSGSSSSQKRTNFKKDNTIWQENTGETDTMSGGFTHKGGASRFYYQAKVSKSERNMGLDGFEEKKKDFETDTRTNKETADKFGCERKGTAKNTHPTVKPINLMTYLCRLITPQGGIVLDLFMGSGSTGIAAQLEGFRFVGMELDEDYFKIASARIENYEKYRKFIK